MSLHICPALCSIRKHFPLSRNFNRLVGLPLLVQQTLVLFSLSSYVDDMKLPLCLIYSMLFCVLLSSAEVRFNIDLFVDVILAMRRFYSAATVMFAHPGDDYKDYGGQFKTVYMLLLH